MESKTIKSLKGYASAVASDVWRLQDDALLEIVKEIFQCKSSDPGEMLLEIVGLSKTSRKKLCRAYRNARGIPHPQLHRHSPKKAKAMKRALDYLSPTATRPKQFLKLPQNTGHKPQPPIHQKPIAGQPTESMIREFYASWEWKRLSYDVKLERGRVCECCGARPPQVVIHTDHVKPLRLFWHLRLNRRNMQVLCEDCNMGKGSRDQTDFRVFK